MTYFVGGTQRFEHTERDADGNVLTPVAGSWSSGDESIATITQDGDASWIAPGATNLYFTTAQGARVGAFPIVVEAAPPATLTATPSTVSVWPETVATLAIAARDASDNVVALFDVDSATSNDETVAKALVLPNRRVMIVGAAAGTCTVTITSGDASTPVNVSCAAMDVYSREETDAAIAAEASARDAAIAALVNSAPGTLDTLKELADAMGDDANFAATMATALAGKLSLAGGNMTGPIGGGVQGTSPTTNVNGISTYAWWIPATAASGTRQIYGLSAGAFIDGAGDASTPSKVIAGISASGATLATRTGATDQLYGGFFLAQKQNVTGNVSFLSGAFIQAENQKGTVVNQFGFSVLNRVRNTATSTLVAGLYVSRPALDSGSSVTDYYGLLLEDPTAQAGAVANYWGVVSRGTAPSVFGGKVTATGGFAGDGSLLTSLAWANLTGRPTTIAGYGITDFNSLGDARWLKQVGGVIYDGTNNSTTITFQVGQASAQQNAAKFWGKVFLGNNNDTLNNSTASGFLHIGSFAGVTLGLNNSTVFLKAIAGGITLSAPLILASGAPASASAAGTAGQVAYDANFIYVCTAASTWKRAALSTWP